jgi:AcrR family transcriptional regulator
MIPRCHDWPVPQSEAPLSRQSSHLCGSRREARTEAILRAALEELAEVGYSALSIEAVAARVGIAKTTVYRRYPTRLDLVRAAVGQHLDEALGEPPDTGSLRGDLIALGRQTSQLASSVIGKGLFRTRLLDRVEPELDRMAKDFQTDREQRHRVIADRAVRRGELASRADFDNAVELLSGALLFRSVFKRDLVDELEITRIVDLLMHGLQGTNGRGRGGARG